MESRDFWDEDAQAAMGSTYLVYGQMRDRLTQALTARWGAPEFVDLGAALDRALAGEPLPPTVDHLCNVASGPAPPWRLGRRTVMVAVAWDDKELPWS
ncbi:hypothetical protein Cs7R123_37420 [Catellatospora sp. TT07R-123]|nr:hypothetical protein Cs7R123_37420 [Catellatospora sp. TT07R-123]